MEKLRTYKVFNPQLHTPQVSVWGADPPLGTREMPSVGSIMYRLDGGKEKENTKIIFKNFLDTSVVFSIFCSLLKKGK